MRSVEESGPPLPGAAAGALEALLLLRVGKVLHHGAVVTDDDALHVVGPGTCAELGHTVAFDKARMDSLYGSDKNYLAKFNQSVDQLVKAGWFTESDGKKIKANATRR